VAEFKYLGRTQKSKFDLGRTYRQIKSGECLQPCSSKSFDFYQPSKNVKIKIYKTIFGLFYMAIKLGF